MDFWAEMYSESLALVGIAGRKRRLTSGHKVDAKEEDHKGEEDPDVSPLVRVVVFVRQVHVGIAADKGGSRFGTDHSANRVERATGRVAGSRRYELRASVVLVVELVDHERLEAVCDGVDVVDPSRPSSHLDDGNGKSGVDDETDPACKSCV